MKRYWMLLFSLSCFLPSALSQTGLQHRGSSPPLYTLGPGDQLVVHISDVDEVTDKPVRIDPGGFIDLPLAGRIQASGLTLEQLKAMLGDRYRRYVTAPEIAVNLAESSSQPVSVVGELNNPGVYQLGSSRSLLEMISLSGGLKSDAGATVIVTRDPRYGPIFGSHTSLNQDGYSTATFSLDALLSSKAPQDNIPIQPNDVISVPRAELVYVLGDVHKAGGFQLSTHPSVSLLQALSLAEGLAPDNSASHARILRQYPGGDGIPREIAVDIPRIYAGKDPDVPLLANDVLFVPHSGIKVTSRRAMEAAIGITSGLLIYR